MFLDTVKNILLDVPGAHKTTAVRIAAKHAYAEWQDYPITTIHHHGKTCCEMAREWMIAMDYSMLNGESAFTGPRWIRQRYEWGPTEHPIHWCEAVKRKMLDCGALAALAHECFLARGISSFRVQLVQQYSESDTSHWGDKWKSSGSHTHWINKECIYHEGCAVLCSDGKLKIWDASAGWWLDSLQKKGYGSVAAIKLHLAEPESKDTVLWGAYSLPVNVWHEFHD
jgi:hypothetical protein